jgi:hypothetical protein
MCDATNNTWIFHKLIKDVYSLLQDFRVYDNEQIFRFFAPLVSTGNLLVTTMNEPKKILKKSKINISSGI